MGGSRRRPWWRVLGLAAVSLLPLAFLLGLLHLVPETIQREFALIGYGGAVAGAACFLVFASGRPASSEQKEAFRQPMRIMVVGGLLLAAFAFVLMLGRPDSSPSGWVAVLLLVLLAGGIVFIWIGNRKVSKAEDTYPGKHARRRPQVSRESDLT